MSNESDPENRFADCEDVEQLLYQLAGAASICWQWPARAGIFDSGQAKEFCEMALERLDVLRPVDNVTHDSETLDKVLNALLESGLDHKQAREAISHMNSLGILFRERKR